MVSWPRRVWRARPGQRLPRCGRLAVVLPVLAEDPGHLGQLVPGRIGQRSNPEAIHALTLPAHPPPGLASRFHNAPNADCTGHPVLASRADLPLWASPWN
jgi:hypothetical protein